VSRTTGTAVGSLEVKNSRNDASTHAGWTIGGGIEAAFTDNIIGRLEYRYTDLGTHNFATAPRTNVDFQSSQVMVGVGYKF